jgi:ubiquinol-cytochrome c reductase iron-sulfur subunit
VTHSTEHLPAQTTEHLPAEVEPEEPIPNPGVHRHEPRPTDIDPRAEKRAERQVTALFALSSLCTLLFVVAYFAFEIGEDPDTVMGLGASTVALGLSLGLGLLLLGLGVIHLARKLMDDTELVEMRHPSGSSDEDKASALKELDDGIRDSTLGRRPLIRNSMFGAMGLLGIPLIVGLRDLYPGELSKAPRLLESTVWESGTRIVNDVTGRPVRAADMEIGQLVNAEPEGLVTPHSDEERAEGEARGIEFLEGVDLQVAKTKSAVILVRMEPKDITFSDRSPENWSVSGILCYSKICTHVGCPISLWEQQTHHLLCPCHQSTFDLTDAGRVVFGPAARALPQLPIKVDGEGYLVAQSDFTEPVGPSFWERDSE